MNFTYELPAIGQSSTLLVSIGRLLALIEEENKILSEHKVISHAGFADRKNQVLRELISAGRSELGTEAAEACRPLLVRLTAALERNARLLKLHIGAVGEISDTIVSGLRAVESDGTYSKARSSRKAGDPW